MEGAIGRETIVEGAIEIGAAHLEGGMKNVRGQMKNEPFGRRSHREEATAKRKDQKRGKNTSG